MKPHPRFVKISRSLLRSYPMVGVGQRWLRALCCGLSLALASCAGSTYVAPGVQAPMFREAGELHLAGVIRPGASVNEHGAQLAYLGQAAWAPVDGLALLGAASWIPRPASLTDSVLDAGFDLYGLASLEASYWEGAAGWYHSTGSQERLHYEIFAGYGRGSAQALKPTYAPDPRDGFERIGGRYQRLFLQANYGQSELARWTSRPRLAERAIGAMAWTLRAAWVWYSEYTGTGGSTALPRGLFIEPAFSVRGGSSLIQFEAQTGCGFRFLGKEEMTWTYAFLNLGLHASIGAW